MIYQRSAKKYFFIILIYMTCKIDLVKTNSLQVDNMDIIEGGVFNIPVDSLNGYKYDIDNVTEMQLTTEGILKIDDINELTDFHGVDFGVSILKVDKIVQSTLSGIELANYIKLSANPFFIIYKSNSQDDMTGKSGIDVMVTFDTKIIDIGNCFSSNTFIAPIEGIYEFNLGVHISGIFRGGIGTIQLKVSGGDDDGDHIIFRGKVGSFIDNGGTIFICGSKVLKLSPTNTVIVEINGSSDINDSWCIDVPSTRFTGRLITL